MAGTIVVDRIESDASYASTINVAGQITFSNTVNFGVYSGTAPVAGFYLPSTSNLAFTTASTERMRIDSAGNVGIGTTTSLSKLTALGTTSIVTNGASTRNPVASLRGGNDNNRLDMYVDNSGATAIMGLGAYNVAGGATAMTFYTGADVTERMRIDSSGNVMIGTTTSQVGAKLAVTGGIQGTITSGTAVASTSGTSIDFTGIPSWVKRITVMFNGVSINSTSNIIVQLGAGGIKTSGYSGSAGVQSTTGTDIALYTTGFGVHAFTTTNIGYGNLQICLLGSNTWVASGAFGYSVTYIGVSGGSVTLSGTLDSLRITTVSGTNTFDAGSINIMYEG